MAAQSLIPGDFTSSGSWFGFSHMYSIAESDSHTLLIKIKPCSSVVSTLSLYLLGENSANHGRGARIEVQLSTSKAAVVWIDPSDMWQAVTPHQPLTTSKNTHTQTAEISVAADPEIKCHGEPRAEGGQVEGVSACDWQGGGWRALQSRRSRGQKGEVERPSVSHRYSAQPVSARWGFTMET